ncbi:MAG: hypothetical protein GQF41_0448 [Candidatus Rifleibacterium amylolyticum]|nr:MAG: hypothetical protein GQF41_0448 [Candidatus Rifleibacterium amylolyticum]
MGKDVSERKIYSMLNDFAFQWLFNRPGRIMRVLCRPPA